MKKIILLTLVLGLVSSTAQVNFDNFDDFFDEQFKKIDEDFAEASLKIDEQFAKALEGDWEEVETEEEKNADPEPKPIDLPQAPEKEITESEEGILLTELLKIIEEEGNTDEKPEPVLEKEIQAPRVENKNDQKKLILEVHKLKIQVPIPKKLNTIKLESHNNQSIADFYRQIASLPMAESLKIIQQNYNQKLYNDWSLVLLVNDLAVQAFPGSPSEQALCQWYYLSKLGYDTRIAYNNKNIFLLIHSPYHIYAINYFQYDGKRYYHFNLPGSQKMRGGVYTYESQHPEALNPVDLKINKWPKFENSTKKRKVTFNFQNKTYNIPVTYERGVADLAELYPQVDIPVFFSAPLSSTGLNSLIQSIRPHIINMNETTAVNFLLAFVQHGFKYQTDDQQFGYEKWFFADEVFYYPYADCEDRSVLFANLVEELLGLDVVGLDYPGHIATAVKMKSKVQGDALNHNGGKYIICDPTYIGASYGMQMPGLGRVKVIDF